MIYISIFNILPLYLCIIIIHFFIHNIYQLDLANPQFEITLLEIIRFMNNLLKLPTSFCHVKPYNY